MLFAVVLLCASGCQQAERREAGGDVVASIPLRPQPVPSFDEDVRIAQSELAEGRAWGATRRLVTALRDSVRRTPEAILIAARAAAGWGGWDEVTRLLENEPWLASRFSGEGHELLARSALERNDSRAARTHAEAALQVASDQASRAVRTVLVARVLDRMDIFDSAATLYRRAADALPAARDWLLLRAAGSTRDVKARERLYGSVKIPAATARVAHTEAQTLERFRANLAAAEAYEKLGDMPSAFRLRLATAENAAQRSATRAGLLGYIQRDARGDDLTRALEVLDAVFPRLDVTSELIATRRATEAGMHGRAASGYAGVPASALTDADVIAWARALIQVGRPTQGAARIAARRFGTAAAPEAAYVRALAFVRAGRTSQARTALQRVITAYPNTSHAADALYLFADLETDARRDTRARDLFERSCTAKAPGGFSDDACFRSGILSFALGNARRAAVALDGVSQRFPQSPELSASLYWAGRAWERAGSPGLATQRWTTVIRNQPLSFYSSGSARRLGLRHWTPAPAQVPRSPRFQGALTRAAVLEHLGMDTEERHEYDFIEQQAKAPAEMLTAGAVMLDRGEIGRAIRLGWRAVNGGANGGGDSTIKGDERGYSLAYPILREVALLSESRQNRLDPALVAAVIRQESSWNPKAVSRAGARGLMQIMPRVGQAIARSQRYPVWDPQLLFDPDVSLDLGTLHLRAALSEYSSLPRALAAYNAGGSRVRRWNRLTGASDPELFIERIPFVETRDYVRIVMRNAELYAALHGLRR